MATVGILLAAATGLAAYLYGPATHGALTKMGVFRQLTSTPLAHPDDLVVIGDTVHCEDLHYYAPAHTLFTACEDVSATRFQWFPPLALYGNASAGWAARGSIHTIDPETKVSRRLAFENFDGPFVTHGIDVIPDPEWDATSGAGPGAVYVFAVNHVPNEAVFPRDGSSPPARPSAPKSASRIEVFHHVLGSGTVRHARTIAHPLVRTPNDVYAVGPAELYVTNDHRHRGGLLRAVEDAWPGARWSDVVHAAAAADGSVAARVAADGLHNPNGLGRGRDGGEVLLASACGGYVQLGRRAADGGGGGGGGALVLDGGVVDLPSAVDNPSWYADPYAGEGEGEGGGDASGLVLGGLARGVDLAWTAGDPRGREGVLVWYVKPKAGGGGGEGEGEEDGGERWEKRLLWQDDGSIIRNVATAVLVGIDPKREGGRKRAWLFVTGFSSENAVAVKVDL